MKQILLVEDNENNRLLVEDFFRRHKSEYQLQCVADAREVWTRVIAAPPDLILLDMRLPHISGWELAQQLKQNPQTHSIPIIAVTAHAMKGDEEKALSAGCDDFLTKPLQRQLLLEKVQKWLKASRVEAPEH